MTYAEAILVRNQIESELKSLEDQLKQFSRNAAGLTPDSIKFSKHYQDVKNKHKICFQRLQTFNAWFVKQFKREIREARKQR